MAGKGIIIQIQGDGAGAAEALRIIEERMQQTAERGTEMSETLQEAGARISEALSGLGLTLGIGEAVAKMKEMVGSSVDLGMEIGHLSQQTGISTENLSLLKYASEQTGVSFDTLQKGFKKLSTEMFLYQQGSKEAHAAFGLLNISQQDLAKTGGDMFKVMELVSERMQAMPDSFQKNAAATQLFGRAGAALIPLLNQGSAALEQMRSDAEDAGVVLSEEMVEKMEAVHKAATAMESAFQGLSLEITGDLAPSLARVATNLERILEVSRQHPGTAIEEMLIKGLALDKLANGAAKFLGGGSNGQSPLQGWIANVDSEFNGQQFHAPPGQPNTDPFKQGQSSYNPEPESVASANKSATQLANLLDAENKTQADAAAKELAALNAQMSAELRLREAGDAQQLEAAKDAVALQLAVLDAKHSEGLEKERDYLAQKLQIEQTGYQAEQQALEAKRAQIQASIDSQHDTTKQTDLKTQLVEVETKLAKLAEERQASEVAITAEIQKQRNIPSGGTSYNATQQHDQMDSRAQEAQEAGQISGRFFEQLGRMNGKDPLKAMVQDMISDLDRLATEVLEKQFIIPLLQQLFSPGLPSALGGGADPLGLGTGGGTGGLASLGLNPSDVPGFADGGSPDGLSMVGENGPELFMPPTSGGTVLPNDVLNGLAKAGGSGGGSPNVTMNLVNNSSQPLQAKPPTLSYDAQAKSFIIHTMIEDMQQGGPVSQALRTGS